MPTETFVRSGRNVRPIATAHWPGDDFIGRCITWNGQIGHAADFQEHEHPTVIGSNELGRRLLARGESYQNRSRLLGEIEGARENVAIGRNYQAGCGAVREKHVVDDIEAADCADLNDGGRDGIGGGFEGRLFAALRANRAPERSKEEQLQIAKCKMQTEKRGAATADESC